MPIVRSVNIARSAVEQSYAARPTGIGKQPVRGPVEVRAPGSKRSGLGSGLLGDVIGDHRHHGGDDQAVYVVAREVLDHWQQVLARPLPDGYFGENLTTAGIDVDTSLLGERWRVGARLELQLTSPRIPCNTFRGWVGERGWLKSFTADGRSGAYFRVVVPGPVVAGDPIAVVHRPAHGVTVMQAFRALMTDPAGLPALAAAGEDLVDDLRRSIASARS